MGDLNVRLICEVFNAQQTFHVLRAVFREGHRLELFVEGVILFVFSWRTIPTIGVYRSFASQQDRK